MDPSEHNEISLHELKVYRVFLAQPDRWLTNQQIATDAGVAGRTARAHTRKLVTLGVLDQAEVFPAHRYRLAPKAGKRNKGYVQRLAKASEVFT